jgi:uncharacterized sulfatase
MSTACEMAKVDRPQNLDSVSFLPTLKGKTRKQDRHEYLYWEFYERTFRQAVVRENWKLIRSGMDDNQVELYDLDKDIHEDLNLAKEQPALVQSLLAQMEEAHQPHPSWPTPRSKKK